LNISGSVTASNVNLVGLGTNPGPNTLLVLETATNKVFSTSNITASLFGTASWASNAVSSSFATTASAATSITFIPATASYALSATATLPAGVISSSTQFTTLSNPFTGSFTGSFKGDGTGLTGVTATAFPYTGAAVISGSLTVTGSGINVISGSVSASAVRISGRSDTALVLTDGNGSAIIDTIGSFLRLRSQGANGIYTNGSGWYPEAPNTLELGGSLGGPSVWKSIAGTIITASIISASSGITGSLFGSSSYALSASYAPGGSATFPYTGTAVISGSLNVSGSVTASNVNLINLTDTTNANKVLVLETATGKLFTTSSIGSTFPYTGNAVISGSLTITGSNALNITGSATIVGAFQATTKSFKIDHQRLMGKKLIYGVVEAPEHSVMVRGKLSGINTIILPDEWEWLVDHDSITVHLTSIGKHQELFVQEILSNRIIIGSDMHINCFYTVQATRKDVDPLVTVE
jgi:hypothetical protein